MIFYKVIALSVGGRANKIYKSGEVVPETAFYPSSIYQLIKNGFIAEDKGVEPSEPVLLKKETEIKIGICTAVWKRPEIFELFSLGITNLIKNTNIPIEIIVAGSEGKVSEHMVKSKGYNYIEIPNDPLATKMNSTTLKACELKCTHIICVGSDDIITPKLFEKYIEFIRKGYDYIAVLDWYFYDTVTKKASYWGGYRDARRLGHTCGAGRVLSANLLSKWNWTPWEIKDSKVLDNSMQNKLIRTPHSIKTFSLKEFGLFALGVKSSTNMTPFELWDNTVIINNSIIKKEFNFLNL